MVINYCKLDIIAVKNEVLQVMDLTSRNYWNVCEP